MIIDEIAEASPARRSTRPLRSAAPSITSATDRARASGVNRCRISPTTSPPSVGTAITQYQSRLDTKECSRAVSSVP